MREHPLGATELLRRTRQTGLVQIAEGDTCPP